MGLIPNIDKVTKAEGFDFQSVKKVIKEFNDAGILKKNIGILGNKENVVDSFLKAVESIPEGSEEEKKVPVNVVNLYNSFVDVIQDKAVDLVEAEKTEPSTEVQSEPSTVEKEKKESKISKNMAFVMVMKKGGTRENIIKEAERIFCEAKDIVPDLDETPKMIAYVGDALLLLERLELVKKTDDGVISLIGK